MWAEFGLFTLYCNISFDMLDVKTRKPLQSNSVRKSFTHSKSISCVRRFDGMCRYFNSLQLTSRVRVLREFMAFIFGTLAMLLTVTDLNSRKAFISHSNCLCLVSNSIHVYM